MCETIFMSATIFIYRCTSDIIKIIDIIIAAHCPHMSSPWMQKRRFVISLNLQHLQLRAVFLHRPELSLTSSGSKRQKVTPSLMKGKELYCPTPGGLQCQGYFTDSSPCNRGLWDVQSRPAAWHNLCRLEITHICMFFAFCWCKLC